MADPWLIATAAAKFAQYLGCLTVAGLAMCAVFFAIEMPRWTMLGFGLLGLLGAALVFGLKGAVMTGDITGMFDAEMLGLVWSTSVRFGLIWLALGLGLLFFAMLIGRDDLAALGGITLLWSFGYDSHVARFETLLLHALLWVHLCFVAFWIGVLIPLRRLARSPYGLVEAAELGARFGHAALRVVPNLIIAGLVMALILVGDVTALLTTDYGQALLLKIGLVALLLTLAAANKTRFVPAMARGEASGARALSRMITLEWCVFWGILAVTATMTAVLGAPT